MKQFSIFGASGCDRWAKPLDQVKWAASSEPCQIVFVDDLPYANDFNVLYALFYAEWIAKPACSRHISITITNSAVRQNLLERLLADELHFFEVSAGDIMLMGKVELGKGSIIFPFVTLFGNNRIGKHFHSKLYSNVEHEDVIGDYFTNVAEVKYNFNMKVEDCAFICLGGAVTECVPSGLTVVGNLAKPLIKDLYLC
jgi:hypothetical protein